MVHKALSWYNQGEQTEGIHVLLDRTLLHPSDRKICLLALRFSGERIFSSVFGNVACSTTSREIHIASVSFAEVQDHAEMDTITCCVL